MKKKPETDWEQEFFLQAQDIGLPTPIRQHKGIENRQFRFDFFFPSWTGLSGIVAEIEGGTWGGSSRHTSKAGFARDCEKYNLATKQGYEVYRFTTDKVKSGEAVNFIREVIVERENGVRTYPTWTAKAYPRPKPSKHICGPSRVSADSVPTRRGSWVL